VTFALVHRPARGLLSDRSSPLAGLARIVLSDSHEGTTVSDNSGEAE
jgi:hypothetical protein